MTMTREEYLIAIECGNWTSIYSCYGNLDPLVYRDCNSFPFGVPLVEGSIHEVFLKNLEVKLIGFNNIFKQGRTRNFRTEKEKVYQLFAEPVPEWLMEEVDAVFTRGEVYIGGTGGVGGTKYLVKDTAFELVDACLGLWKPSATFHTHCGMPFGCDDPCAEESGESGEPGGPETCCNPAVTGATSVPNGEGGNTVTVTFTPCTPTPSGGYNITYREAGSSDPYTSAGPFVSSPAVFGDNAAEGTQYEGFIRSDCGSGVLGNQIPWSTAGNGDINWNYINDIGLGGRFKILVNGVIVVNVTTTQSGSITVQVGDFVELIVQSTVIGTAETDITGPYTNSTSAAHITADDFTAVSGAYVIDGHSF